MSPRTGADDRAEADDRAGAGDRSGSPGVEPTADHERPRLRWIVQHDLDPAPSGALNMARDEAAARVIGQGSGGRSDSSAPGEPSVAFLRFYRWERPTLSFGRNEPARDRFDPNALAAAGVDVVRRPTGGRAVLHDRELTYSVVVPIRAPGNGGTAAGVDSGVGPSGTAVSALATPRELYTRINRALAEGLRQLGVPAEVAGDGPIAGVDAGPCFDAPAPGEVTAHGRKLVGSAQARIGRALLQHGSILMHDDQPRMAELAQVGSTRAIGEGRGAGRGGATLDVPASPPIALAELMNPLPEPSELADVLESALRDALVGDSSVWPGGTPGKFTFKLADAEAEYESRHRDRTWVWRR